MTLKIDKGVPVPKDHAGNSEHGEAIAKMKPGDSVFFKDAKAAQQFYNLLAFHNRNTKFGGSKRKVKGGWRVWRTPSKRGPGVKGKK